MKLSNIIYIMLLLAATLQGHAQKTKNMTDKNNPLLCNPQTGICEMPGDKTEKKPDTQPVRSEQVLRIVYFTDPICSSCWGIEPQLRKLKLEYGKKLQIEYHMGGLLPDWSYNSGGISKPSDVASHWDEVSLHYDMPIDGDVWIEDPLDGSYPPSIAFKAAELQDKEKAVVFMRALRELVFMKKKNITRWENIRVAAIEAKLDEAQLKKDYESGKAKALFEQDLELARKYGVRGFPSVFVTNAAGASEFVYGSRPYSDYQTAIEKLGLNIEKQLYAKDWESLFGEYPSMTAREYSELSMTSRDKTVRLLDELTTQGKLEKTSCKNGDLWKLKQD